VGGAAPGRQPGAEDDGLDARRRALPDDPLVHVCALAYASDMTLLDSLLLRQRLAWAEDTVTRANLDHAMWFHAPFRADDCCFTCKRHR
jgi:acyl-CoA thioesterase II